MVYRTGEIGVRGGFQTGLIFPATITFLSWAGNIRFNSHRMHWLFGWETAKEKVKMRILMFLKYLRENPGSGFVILFMILLIICAFLLAGKSEKAARILANWAYLFLIIGLVMKLVEMKRFR